MIPIFYASYEVAEGDEIGRGPEGMGRRDGGGGMDGEGWVREAEG